MRVEPDLSQRGGAVGAEHLHRQPISRGTGFRGGELDIAEGRVVGGKGGERPDGGAANRSSQDVGSGRSRQAQHGPRLVGHEGRKAA